MKVKVNVAQFPFSQEPSIDKYGKPCVVFIWKISEKACIALRSRYDAGRLFVGGTPVAKCHGHEASNAGNFFFFNPSQKTRLEKLGLNPQEVI